MVVHNLSFPSNEQTCEVSARLLEATQPKTSQYYGTLSKRTDE